MNKPLQTLAKLAEAVGVDYSAINSDDMIIQTAEAALKRIEELNRAVLEEIEHRDDHAESADMLANEIARFFSVDIGEHSSANFPWGNAFEAIPDTTLAALKAQWQAEQYSDGMPAQKAFWEGFERGVMNGPVNIRAHWNEYKRRVQGAGDE